MSIFHSGPADGVTLSFRSAPPFLRLVHNPRAPKHPWDGLDQPGDTAKAHEQLHAYRRRKEPFYYHASYRSKDKRLSGSYMNADYDYLTEQPADEVLRDNARWKAWCAEQPLGESRAKALEELLKSLGVLDPLSFSHTWCRWQHASLSDLTEIEGTRLVEEAKKAIKILGAKPKQSHTPEGIYRG